MSDDVALTTTSPNKIQPWDQYVWSIGGGCAFVSPPGGVETMKDLSNILHAFLDSIPHAQGVLQRSMRPGKVFLSRKEKAPLKKCP